MYNVYTPQQFTFSGSSSPSGHSSLKVVPSEPVSVSVMGLKSSLPAKARAVTIYSRGGTGGQIGRGTCALVILRQVLLLIHNGISHTNIFKWM